MDSSAGNPLPATGRTRAERNSRLGMGLFWLYLAMYGSFVLVNAFAPEQMEATPIAGVNVAILGGLGLIFAAIVMAMLYGWACRTRATDGPHGERS